MRAYLTEGELMSDHATLARLATAAGVPAEAVRELLAGDRYAADVRADERTGAALGITASRPARAAASTAADGSG